MAFHNSDQSGDASWRNNLLTSFSKSPLRGKSRVQIIAIGLPEDVLQFMYRIVLKVKRRGGNILPF